MKNKKLSFAIPILLTIPQLLLVLSAIFSLMSTKDIPLGELLLMTPQEKSALITPFIKALDDIFYASFLSYGCFAPIFLGLPMYFSYRHMREYSDKGGFFRRFPMLYTVGINLLLIACFLWAISSRNVKYFIAIFCFVSPFCVAAFFIVRALEKKSRQKLPENETVEKELPQRKTRFSETPKIVFLTLLLSLPGLLLAAFRLYYDLNDYSSLRGIENILFSIWLFIYFPSPLIFPFFYTAAKEIREESIKKNEPVPVVLPAVNFIVFGSMIFSMLVIPAVFLFLYYCYYH